MQLLAVSRRWLTLAALAALWLATAHPSSGQLCATPGRDGAVSATGTVNSYYPGVGTPAAGDTSLTVGARAGAAVSIISGDLVMIMQMQDATIDASNTDSYGDGVAGGGAQGSTINGSGNYEFVVATNAVAAAGGTLTFKGGGAGNGLINAYATAAAAGANGQKTYQVIRVPQYSSVTLNSGLTALRWNGSVGGVLAIDVNGTAAFNGATVDVSARGYRGGGGVLKAGDTGGANTDVRTVSTKAYNGAKAEGIAGTPIDMWSGTALVHGPAEGYPNGAYARGAPGNAGGGATDGNPAANDQNAGGGGGANGGAGGVGGNSWNSNLATGGYGGAAFANTGTRLALGGGGGAGSLNNGDDHFGNNGLLSNGGRGGAIIHLRFGTASGTATLRSDGAAGATVGRDGGAGGGAGGTVFAAACKAFSGLTVQARGGAGGTTNWSTEDGGGDVSGRDDHGPGGGGGGGAVLTSSAATVTVTGGANGLAGETVGSSGNPSGLTPVQLAYGATAGAAGTSSSAVTVSSPLGAAAGCTCNPTAAVVVGFRALAQGGHVVVEWETASEVGTVGFQIYRIDPRTGERRPIQNRVLAGLQGAPQGGSYRVVDASAPAGATAVYELVEIEASGAQRAYGPWSVLVRDGGTGGRGVAATAPLGATAHPAQEALTARLAAADAETAAQREPLRQSGADDPLNPRVKLAVQAEGWYSVSSAKLATLTGLPRSAIDSIIASGAVRLTNRGREVARQMTAGGFYFYGQPIASIYTSDNVYVAELGRKGVPIAPAAGLGPTALTTPQSFTAVQHLEQQSFAATAVAQDPTRDYWFWDFISAGDPTYGHRSFSFDLPGEVAGTAGKLRVALYGATKAGPFVDHHVTVSLNGTPLGELRFDGIGAVAQEFPVPGGVFLALGNRIDLTGLLDTGAPYSFVYVDSFDATYSRETRAIGGRLAPIANGSPVMTVAGFESPAIAVLDVGDPFAPRLLPTTVDSGDGYRASFAQRAGGHYFLASAAAVVEPAMTLEAPPDQHLDEGADYVIVAPSTLLAAAQDLAAYRQHSGLKTRVVELTSIYDQFNDAIASPEAIRTFLARARSWSTPPRYVLLVGRGNFDYKDYFGLGGNLMPPMMYATPYGLFASDAKFVTGNLGPTIGRLPVVSGAEITAYIAKLQAYESGSAGTWSRHVVLSADNADDAGNFPLDSEALRNLLSGFAIDAVYLNGDPAQVTPAHDALLTSLAPGAVLWNYIGHGALDRLAAEPLFSSADVGQLHIGSGYPAFVTMTCAVGRFEVPGFASLAESLVLSPNGAIVALSPSGLSIDSEAVKINQDLVLRLLDGPSRPAFGDAARGALTAYGNRPGAVQFLRWIYNVIGDPAVSLR